MTSLGDGGKWEGFDWDEGNLFKNWEKHRVAASECEQVFFNRPLVTVNERHSTREPRFYALGATDAGRYLFLVFTERRDVLNDVVLDRLVTVKLTRMFGF